MSFSPGDYSDWSLRGEGGEAEIFRARQISLDRLVAIKRLKLSSIGDAEDIRRFEREAKLCASLNHPNLVPIFEYGSEGKFYYLVMEFVNGVDLGKMADMPPLTIPTADENCTTGQPRCSSAILPETLKVHLARQMVEVVDFIQQKGVLHRDLKPENFMADSAARIKLLDLGMAIVQFQSQTDTLGKTLKGTLAYLPPEVLRGQGAMDKVSEQYSLALVLLELFQGSRYYKGKTSDEVVTQIQVGIPIEEMKNVPLEIRKILSPYLNPEPRKRPKTLEAMLRGLKAIQANTLAISGGREALQSVIGREQWVWLWTMVNASEAGGRIDEAYSRLLELLEIDPENAEAQAKLQGLSLKINEETEAQIQPTTFPNDFPKPHKSSDSLLVPHSGFIAEHTVNGKTFFQKLALVTAVMVVIGASVSTFFYIRDQSRTRELGRDLLEREMSQLSKDNESSSQMMASSALGNAHKPSLQPYGILRIYGLPKDYRVWVDGVRNSGGGEIHLLVARHFVEIRDANDHPVMSDSINVGGGEPAIFDFQRRVGKK